ncbi:hypothetical protein D3C72_1488930 [compost metagenome]
MEGIFERHDPAFLRAEMVVGIFARQLQGRFVGLSTGVTEENFLGKGRVDQLFRQTQRRLVGVAVTGMPELRRLIVEGLAQRRVCVP